MQLLVVEDDDFKFHRIEAVVQRTATHFEIKRADNVQAVAVEYLQNHRPDFIVLDMSLPTNAVKPGEGSPKPMPMGGVEILLEVRELGYRGCPILILTQYQDFEIDEEPVLVSEAKERIHITLGLARVSADVL